LTPRASRGDRAAADAALLYSTLLLAVSMTYAGLRWRAVGTCFSQHETEQNRSLRRPVLHDATVHRTAEAAGGINLRHVAQTMLAMPRGSTRMEPRTTRPHFDKGVTSRVPARAVSRNDAVQVA
jgi:hypothetical protein